MKRGQKLVVSLEQRLCSRYRRREHTERTHPTHTERERERERERETSHTRSPSNQISVTHSLLCSSPQIHARAFSLRKPRRDKQANTAGEHKRAFRIKVLLLLSRFGALHSLCIFSLTQSLFIHNAYFSHIHLCIIYNYWMLHLPKSHSFINPFNKILCVNP